MDDDDRMIWKKKKTELAKFSKMIIKWITRGPKDVHIAITKM